ncbi:MAG: recombinase RecA [Cyanobacteria bacterium]|nr:recombinase RecA [Cyanobacteriota bacterium]MDA1020332.1 recombinase RecA [Cyanobacteriota bacterium]
MNKELQSKTDKLKTLTATLAQIDKNFGKGSVMRLGDKPPIQIDVIPTGAITLDICLGIGGIPRGRIIEIYGPESSGKTTLALSICAQAQKKGGIAAIVDAEHALDPVYAKALGVNTDDLLVSQPDTGEQALEITEHLVRSAAVDVIVIDSVAALVPKAEIDGEMGDSLPGLQARLMSQALRKLTAIAAKTNTTIIFINQIRYKIGVMFGSPETTSGGNALKFYSSVRMDIRRIETLKKDGEGYGNRVKVKVVKNKVAPPFRLAEFDIIFGQGINTHGAIFDSAVDMDIVKKAGAWYSYNGEKIGQGRDNSIIALKATPLVFDEIELKIKAELDAQKAVATGVDPQDFADMDEDESEEEIKEEIEEEVIA